MDGLAGPVRSGEVERVEKDNGRPNGGWWQPGDSVVAICPLLLLSSLSLGLVSTK